MKICHILWVISFFEIEHQLRNRLNRDNKTNGLVWGAATLIVQTDLKGDREVKQLFCYSGVRTRTLSWFISMWILWLMKKKIRYLQYFYSVGRLELGALFVDPLSLNSIGGGGGGVQAKVAMLLLQETSWQYNHYQWVVFVDCKFLLETHTNPTQKSRDQEPMAMCPSSCWSVLA